ncbi:flagellar assembly protein FliH [Aestuariibacter sp. AA17]|uniref:Flagellar assembly protein FliH n=1 Tax=Fluctibacter corallii TaxID=2984329 RepID=A0ABT3A9Q9_9ALTE|nr:flagellar assembly protein FliH [Aestuariibacter sp. AA17]MCV2885420.1 flagellar assembly protein FliH [Aestuariibacter sp. AA17]
MSKPTLPSDEAAQAQSWELPFVEDDKKVDDSKTNAFNKRSTWKYEPPEEEEEILPPTAEEIEAIRTAAHQDGFEQGQQEGLAQGLEEGRAKGLEEGHAAGKEQGYQEGLAQAQEEIATQLDVWKGLMEHLHEPIKQVDDALKEELVKLATSLAKAVIRSEVKTNNDIIFQALSEGLKVLPIQESKYQIHVNPDDIALIKAHFSDEEIQQHNWVFVEAPQMSRGGCDITTDSNAVDVSIERRTREVLDTFLLQQGLSENEGDA